VHTKMLMQGGADLSEALYLTTFYEDVPHLSVDPHQALQDLLKIFRFQFKTNRNKIECLKIQLREKNNICIATKNCSVSCDVLDKPVFDFSSPV